MTMDTLETLRLKIPDYPGYANEDDRRKSDELVRSYVGEALAELRDRVAALDGKFDSLLMRAGFTNQSAFRAFESARLDDARAAGMYAADLDLVELADRSERIEAGAIDVHLADVDAAFDRRERSMESGT